MAFTDFVFTFEQLSLPTFWGSQFYSDDLIDITIIPRIQKLFFSFKFSLNICIKKAVPSHHQFSDVVLIRYGLAAGAGAAAAAAENTPPEVSRK